MTYPQHYLLQFGGTRAPLSSEGWTCGIRCRMVAGGFDDFDAQAWLDGEGGEALAAWFARASSAISSNARLVFAKMNLINTTGHYENETTIEHEFVGGVQGGGGNSIGMPWQSAVCLSWETTTKSRGPGSKGRIYSPAPQVIVNTDNGLFGTGQAQGMATSAATLLTDLRNAVDGGGGVLPCIVSDVGAGQANVIDRVRVDNRVDIIRKRAAQLTPASTFAAVA